MEYVVVDTDVASFLFKNNSRALLYKPLLNERTLVLSFMSLAELERWELERQWGAAKTERFQSFLNQFVIFPFHRTLCRAWAEVTHHRRTLGRSISHADAWIAATALHHGLRLVTHNAKDFRDMPNLQVDAADESA